MGTIVDVIPNKFSSASQDLETSKAEYSLQDHKTDGFTRL